VGLTRRKEIHEDRLQRLFNGALHQTLVESYFALSLLWPLGVLIWPTFLASLGYLLISFLRTFYLIPSRLPFLLAYAFSPFVFNQSGNAPELRALLRGSSFIVVIPAYTSPDALSFFRSVPALCFFF